MCGRPLGLGDLRTVAGHGVPSHYGETARPWDTWTPVAPAGSASLRPLAPPGVHSRSFRLCKAWSASRSLAHHSSCNKYSGGISLLSQWRWRSPGGSAAGVRAALNSVPRTAPQSEQGM